MNKKQITREVAERADFTYKDATELVNTLFEILTEHIINGDEIVIHNFGTFCLKTHKSCRKGNMKTGVSIQIPERKLPKLVYGRTLKDLIKSKYETESYVEVI